MISLGVVAVTRDVSIAVFEDNKCLFEMNIRKEKIDDLVLLINESLNKANKRLADVQEFVVVNGPGSYGGIRNSLTAVKVLALMNEKPIKVVNFLELLAYQNKEYNGLIVVAMESRKDELNYGFFGGTGGGTLNIIILSDTIQKEALYNKLQQIKESFLVVGDLYEVPYLNKGIYKEVKPLASSLLELAKNKIETILNEVAPIYSYPVNISNSKK